MPLVCLSATLLPEQVAADLGNLDESALARYMTEAAEPAAEDVEIPVAAPRHYNKLSWKTHLFKACRRPSSSPRVLVASTLLCPHQLVVTACS